LYRILLVRQQKLDLQKVCPQVVNMTFDANSRGHNYIVSVRNKRPYFANQVGSALLAFPWAIMAKMVIVVDDDINVRDAGEVQWAMATRVDWETDIMMMENMLGPSFDVATGRRTRVSKPIIDATRKLESEGYPMARFPEAGKPAQEMMDYVAKNWAAYGLDD
ncbi:MAG: hypothetical protein GY850_08560, partial [bacterium]|nr:hypothetical protein [bacterium]